MRRWREWTDEQRQRSSAVAAYSFLNMLPCDDCGLPWPEGYTHGLCPGPLPEPEPCTHGAITTDVVRSRITCDQCGAIATLPR